MFPLGYLGSIRTSVRKASADKTNPAQGEHLLSMNDPYSYCYEMDHIME